MQSFYKDPGQVIKRQPMNVAVLLFEDFETLDVFGPVEIFGRLKDHYKVSFFSESGGMVKNAHGISILTGNIEDIKYFLFPLVMEQE